MTRRDIRTERWRARWAVTDVGSRRELWDPLHGGGQPQLHYTTTNVGEAMPGLLTPLTWSVWGCGGEHSMREAAFALGVFTRRERDATRPGIFAVFVGRGAMQVEFMSAIGDRMPGVSGDEAVRGLFGRVPDGMQFQPTKRRYPVIAWRLPLAFARTPRTMRALAFGVDQWWRDSVRRAPELDLADAIEMLTDADRRFRHALVVTGIGILAGINPVYDALNRVVSKAGTDNFSILSAPSGGAEMAIVADLWRASRGLIDIADIVERHGFHGPGEGTLASRVWRDDDSPLRKMVAQYADRDDGQDPARQEQTRRHDHDVAERQLLEAVSWWQRPAVRLLLRLADTRLPLRGVGKRPFLQTLDVARVSARRIGTLLVENGTLSTVDDVFQLTIEELTGPIPDNANELVDRRRARAESYGLQKLPTEWKGVPDVLKRTHQPMSPRQRHSVLRGVGVSAGVREGIVRVVTNPDFADVEPDEILVASTTDPSWASIMFLSSALIVDIGGPLSHAAVVARELQIPCVVNTRNGTSVLRTGDRVRVDGATGVVEILESADRDKYTAHAQDTPTSTGWTSREERE